MSEEFTAEDNAVLEQKVAELQEVVEKAREAVKNHG